MLRLEGLCCGYGPMRAVHGLNLEAGGGEVAALLGANGAGKSSVIMCLAGHVTVQEGRVFLEDRDITRDSPMARVAKGIALTPEGRRLFARLTVRENLVIGGYCLPKVRTAPNMEKVLTLFPRLGERLDQAAGSLSGGEQQMLSLGRALMSEPKILLVDEISLGLMPKAIDICYEALADLKRRGLSIILVEQSTQRALETADQVLVLESGRTVWSGTGDQARRDSGLIDAFLGLGEGPGS
ncbi:MAG: ABC transporter ATP-binding protein [Pseudomonadota bacterium]